MLITKTAKLMLYGLAAFYVAELTGAVEEGKYFPTLPRFEASAKDPMAWLGAAQWGLTQLGSLAVDQAYAQGYDLSASGVVSAASPHLKQLQNGRLFPKNS